MTALPGNGRFRGVNAEIQIHTARMKIPGLTPTKARRTDRPETAPHSAQVGTVLVP